MSSTPTPVQKPITQEKEGFRSNLPAWVQQLPKIQFSPPKEDFQLINAAGLEEILKSADSDAIRRIREDITFLDHELLRLFRERDYIAKFSQNRYRMYQILYILLSALATFVGSLIALAVSANSSLVIWFSLVETFIALATTYLATMAAREPALPRWIENRRRAESLRREYYRYLMNVTPYSALEGYERRLLLSRRAADINRGLSPEISTTTEVKR